MSEPSSILRPPNVNVTLEGRNIVMRPISQQEISKRYLDWLADPEVVRFLDEVRHKKMTAENIIEYINGLRSRPGCELFAVFTKKDQVHIGNIGVPIYNPHHQGYSGYGILIGDENARALGLGGEASVMMVEFLFRDPKIRRIYAYIYALNEKAWKTVELLGFQREGTLRRHVVLSSGEICDLFVYGILTEEWRKSRQKFSYLLNSMKILEGPA